MDFFDKALIFHPVLVNGFLLIRQKFYTTTLI